MKKEKIYGTLIALLFFSGCTASQIAPKFIWSSNVMKNADGMHWICVGTIRSSELANPVTWFVTTPLSHLFVHPDKAQLLPGSSSTWLVQENMFHIQEGQITYYALYDTMSDKTAIIASTSSTEADFKKNMENPNWKNPDTEDEKNILEWLKNGKPFNSHYCT